MTFQTLTKETIGTYEVGVRNNNYDATKKTVVIIHGIGVSSIYSLPLAEVLAKDYNVRVLDLPGYGKTKKPSHTLSIKELAEVVDAYLDVHQYKNVTVIGHSMGCQIAAHLYAIHPEHIHSLILLAPTTNNAERSIFKQGLRLAQDTFRETLATNFVIFRDYFRMGPIRYLKTARMMVDDHIEVQLKKSGVPTLIVGGERDPIVPRDWIEYLETVSPNSTSKEIKGAAHAFQHEHPEELSSLCRSFIES